MVCESVHRPPTAFPPPVSSIWYLCCRYFLSPQNSKKTSYSDSFCMCLGLWGFLAWYILSLLNLLWAPLNPVRMLRCDFWKASFSLLRHQLTSFFRAPITICISFNKAFNYRWAVICFHSHYPKFHFLLKPSVRKQVSKLLPMIDNEYVEEKKRFKINFKWIMKGHNGK